MSGKVIKFISGVKGLVIYLFMLEFHWHEFLIGNPTHRQVVCVSYKFAMRCLWCLWEVYEVYKKSMRLTDKSIQKRLHCNIFTCRVVARWSRSHADLSMRSMSLIDNSVAVEYRYAFSTALIQQSFLLTNDIALNNIMSRCAYWIIFFIA